MQQKIILDFNTVEDLVLKDNQLTEKLTHLRDEVQSWKLGQFVPALRALAQKAKLDFLNKLTEGDITLIQEHLGLVPVTVEKLDYSVIKNHTMNVSDAEGSLNNMCATAKDYCVYRDGDLLYISVIR